jgi:hypothetical protein
MVDSLIAMTEFEIEVLQSNNARRANTPSYTSRGRKKATLEADTCDLKWEMICGKYFRTEKERVNSMLPNLANIDEIEELSCEY